MKIIRIETVDGVGVYHNDATESIINGGVGDENTWPMPYADKAFVADKKQKRIELYPDDEMLRGPTMFGHMCDDIRDCGLFELYNEELYRFGFKDYAQMEKWICDFEWRIELAERDMQMNVYDVPDQFVMVGDTQITFRLDKAVKIDSLKPTALEWEIRLACNFQSNEEYNDDFMVYHAA